MTDSGTRSGGAAAPPPPAAADGGSARARRCRAAVVSTWCALGGGGVYLLRDRAAVAAGLAVTTVVVACAAVVVGTVLLGGRERRSPFVRFMLLVCVLTGLPPSEYLPPASLRAASGTGPRRQAQARPGSAGAVMGLLLPAARTGAPAVVPGADDGVALGREMPWRLRQSQGMLDR